MQRRYGVSLGRRYALVAAYVVLFSVLGYSQVDSNKSALALSTLPQPETPLQKKHSILMQKSLSLPISLASNCFQKF